MLLPRAFTGGESMEESMYPGPNGAGVVADVTRGRSVASWPAIIAGTFVAISVSLILLALGSGLGVTSLLASPDGISAKAIVVMAAIWLIVTQWISAALGGFIAGRLRARWHGTHTHEVFFRDTAHGLVTWAMATVALAVLAGTSLHSMIAGGLNAGSGISSPALRWRPTEQINFFDRPLPSVRTSAIQDWRQTISSRTLSVQEVCRMPTAHIWRN